MEGYPPYSARFAFQIAHINADSFRDIPYDDPFPIVPGDDGDFAKIRGGIHGTY